MRRTYLLATVVGIAAACSTARAPGTAADEMSAADHRRHAGKHERHSRHHADLQIADLSGGAGQLAPGARIWTAGSSVHLTEESRHAEHARQHLAAAHALEDAEDTACREAPASARGTCPLLEGVAAIDAVAGGVLVHLQPDVALDAVLAALRCHLSRAGTLGHEGMPGCPLYARGLLVRAVVGQPAVEVIAPDAASAAALQRAIAASLP